MSPFQHGEVFVTDDGAETDLTSGIMSGLHTPSLQAIIGRAAIYLSVIEKEVVATISQDHPGHSSSPTIKMAVRKVAEMHEPDVLLVEIGGTVGDIESLLRFSAIRQRHQRGAEQTIFIHVTLTFIAAA